MKMEAAEPCHPLSLVVNVMMTVMTPQPVSMLSVGILAPVVSTPDVTSSTTDLSVLACLASTEIQKWPVWSLAASQTVNVRRLMPVRVENVPQCVDLTVCRAEETLIVQELPTNPSVHAQLG